MSAFDRNEQNIYDAFSQITVDANKLAGQVKSRLNEEIPRAAPGRARWSMPVAAAIAISMVLIAATAAVALGGFDWFIEKFNPSFGEIVEPVGAYCEDQGIRMEVIGAQKYGNMAVAYLSLQDISGQNRLTERTDFQDGFSVKMNPQEQGANRQMGEISAGSFGWSKKMLYFDEETNTVYYEFNITADSDSPLSDPLELGSFLIYFDRNEYENAPVSVTLSGIGEAETVPIVGEDQILAWSGVDDRGDLTEVLAPGNYAPMPHGGEDQWISNIGMIDGKLHVQTGKLWNKEFGSSDVLLSLMAPDGGLIERDYDLIFLGDKEDRLLDLEEDDYDDAVYKYEESVFSVNTEDLEGYTLCYTGSFSTGVKGKWKIAANLSDTSQQIRIWENDIPVEGHLFEHMILSPLGLEVIGSYTGEECKAGEMTLAVETADGVIPLEGGGGSENPQKRAFNFHWNTETPLDVAAVTAVMINGVRIPVQ